METGTPSALGSEGALLVRKGLAPRGLWAWLAEPVRAGKATASGLSLRECPFWEDGCANSGSQRGSVRPSDH